MASVTTCHTKAVAVPLPLADVPPPLATSPPSTPTPPSSPLDRIHSALADFIPALADPTLISASPPSDAPPRRGRCARKFDAVADLMETAGGCVVSAWRPSVAAGSREVSGWVRRVRRTRRGERAMSSAGRRGPGRSLQPPNMITIRVDRDHCWSQVSMRRE